METPADIEALRRILRLLVRWSPLIVLVGALVGAAAWLADALQPRKFESTQTLLYRFGRDYFPISPGEQRRNWGENVNVTLDAAIFSEMRLLSSHELFERTLAKVDRDMVAERPEIPGLANDILTAIRSAFPGDPTPPSPREQARREVRALAKQFVIVRAQGASIVDVSARHALPEVADRLVATHVAVYMDRRRDLFERDASDFFQRQIEVGRDEYNSLLADRDGLLRDFGISDIDVALRVARDRLARVETALIANAGNIRLQGEASEARATMARMNELSDLLAPLNGRIAAAAANVAALEQERANWALTRAYGATVAPTVEIIDSRSAIDNPVGLPPKVKIGLAALFGMLLTAVAVVSIALLRMLLSRTAPPPVPTSDSAL